MGEGLLSAECLLPSQALVRRAKPCAPNTPGHLWLHAPQAQVLPAKAGLLNIKAEHQGSWSTAGHLKHRMFEERHPAWLSFAFFSWQAASC